MIGAIADIANAVRISLSGAEETGQNDIVDRHYPRARQSRDVKDECIGDSGWLQRVVR